MFESKKYNKSDDISLAKEFIDKYDNYIYKKPDGESEFDENYIEQLRFYNNNLTDLNRKKISAILNLLNRRNIYKFLKSQTANSQNSQSGDFF